MDAVSMKKILSVVLIVGVKNEDLDSTLTAKKSNKTEGFYFLINC